jgi:hypothetical protein
MGLEIHRGYSLHQGGSARHCYATPYFTPMGVKLSSKNRLAMYWTSGMEDTAFNRTIKTGAFC